ncbi:hypothetical protein FisN_11Hh288 [Fistulifera solaris]|jgi:deoxyribodipyrimidine photo-lyase|uniref:Photolyase/cryptochrome alpha/beta domain-containing protein n=1 Tax=Fistulifera solaris TaxID=1519565 RepID=A0A1Z5JL83_FISSO|nr:hypothetical protein FisN_11Hh288 [Fistulifera solaris]|eukprot:GAX14744.1 hypothetical protein FisN_11Hh288 [Fistulifera solaris]
MTKKVRLIWHRRDLRLHDNALYQDNTILYSLFVLDPAFTEPRPSTVCQEWQTVWMGPHALSALLHALQSLRESLRECGSDLWIRSGDPVKCILNLARQLKATQVAWHIEAGWYEEQVSRRLHAALTRTGIECIVSMGCNLYHPDDLPQTAQEWNISQSSKYKESEKTKPFTEYQTNGSSLLPLQVPPIMGNFRTACRNFASVRRSLPAPVTMNTEPSTVEPGEIPTLASLLEPLLQQQDGNILGLRQVQLQQICEAAIKRHEENSKCRKGSELWALKRLDFFLRNHAATADRNRADVELNHSSKLSLPLALGSISPRRVYEQAVLHNCSWLISHLEMRDFFLFTAMQAGSKIYRREGLPVRAYTEEWHSPQHRREFWEKWSSGTTGFPLVDAGMRELQATGYFSNRVRQNCASFLTKDLEIDWRAGADLFQFLLEDHCVGANWGNWMYFSGVGSDPKNRHFRTISQALRYDPTGAYVTRWIDELKGADIKEARFRPWGYLAGWRTPVVNPATQLTWDDSRKLKEKGYLCDNK